MKAFVTGGAGFIGSHLVDRLLQRGDTVTVYDNLSSGKREWFEPHVGQANFHFIQGDLLDLAALKERMKGHELVWHLGANTDIPGGNRVTKLDLENCTIATHNVLEAMRHNGIRQVLFTSSSTVYGEIEKMPTAEDAGPLLPISLYGSGKLAGEGLISAYCHLFEIKAIIFRFGNVLGSRMGHGVLYDFIHKLRRDPKEMEILGDGNQDKCFFLVEECIDGMLFALERAPGSCEVYNMGPASTVTVTEIAQIVAEEMGLKDVKFKYTGGKRGWPGDVPLVHLDVAKIKALGWSTQHTSREAIRIATRRLLESL